jgi:hypothetical protein
MTVAAQPSFVCRMFPALAEASLRRYLSGQVASVLGSWTQNVTLNLLVYHLSGSAAILALLNFLLYGPQLIVAPVAGSRISSTNATIQRQCPEHVRGGLVGMYGMAYNGTMPFGYLLVGTASEALGVRHTFAAMAAVLASGVMAVMAWQRFNNQRSGAQ